MALILVIMAIVYTDWNTCDWQGGYTQYWTSAATIRNRMLTPYGEALRQAVGEKYSVVPGGPHPILNTPIVSNQYLRYQWARRFELAIDYLTTQYVNYTLPVSSPGDFTGDQITFWTEPTIMADIGEARIPVSQHSFMSAAWAKQQYEILNRLVWSMVGSDHFIRKQPPAAPNVWYRYRNTSPGVSSYGGAVTKWGITPWKDGVDGASAWDLSGVSGFTLGDTAPGGLYILRRNASQYAVVGESNVYTALDSDVYINMTTTNLGGITEEYDPQGTIFLLKDRDYKVSTFTFTDTSTEHLVPTYFGLIDTAPLDSPAPPSGDYIRGFHLGQRRIVMKWNNPAGFKFQA